MFKHKLIENSRDYAKYFTIKEYSENSLVFNEGDICQSVGLIIHGVLTISTMTLNKEYFINVLQENDLFGDTLIFNPQNTYLGDGIASTKLKVAYITKENLLKLFDDKKILENYLSMIASKTLTIKKQLKLANQKSIRDKILFYLVEYCKEHHTNSIPIKSKELLAKILNIPRPSLSRELLNLQAEGILEVFRKQIILNEVE